MIPKLRRKITIVIMTVMCLFLLGILGFSISSVHHMLQVQTARAVRSPMQREEHDPKFRTPVAAATLSDDGELHIENNQIDFLTEDQIREYITQLSQEKKDSGEIGRERLAYLRRSVPNGTFYVFADTQVDRQFARDQIRNMLLLSAFALICFFITSFLLARWMVRPVARTWDKQRQFVADASHELKTPLTVILSNTEMIARSGVITDPRNLQRLDNISAESKRMRSLVESLLSLARSDNAPDRPPTEIISLSFQVSSAILTLEPSVYDAGHRLVTEIDPDLSMYANPGEITQLVEILIDNACKYSDPGSEILLTLSALSKKEAQLRVRSYGIPLTPRECTEIFERFSRTDASREVTHGYGLGLSIATSIVKHCKGTISAESDGQRTNLFKVRLPLAVSPAGTSSISA